jgi:hypothetical protein
MKAHSTKALANIMVLIHYTIKIKNLDQESSGDGKTRCLIGFTHSHAYKECAVKLMEYLYSRTVIII